MSDAGLLYAIQQGAMGRRTSGNAQLNNAAGYWADFFTNKSIPDRDRISNWGKAEVEGTAFRIAWATDHGATEYAGSDKAEWDAFNYIGNNYRAWQKNGTSGEQDPVIHSLLLTFTKAS